MAILPDKNLPYYDRELFNTDIKSSWAQIVTSDKKGNPGRNPKEASERAYQIFTHTFSSPLPFILIGPDRMREDEHFKNNFGLIVTDPQGKKSQPAKNEGSILGEKQWSLLINDAFLLGAIHARKEVFLVMKVIPTIEQLWDQKTGTFTTLGRELALLQLTGYKRAKTSKNDLVFKREEQTSPQEMTLKEVWTKLEEIRSPDKLQDFVKVIHC